MQDLPVILKFHICSLEKALDLFIEFKFWESDFYFLNGSKNCMVVAYNFGSVCIQIFSLVGMTSRRQVSPYKSEYLCIHEYLYNKILVS